MSLATHPAAVFVGRGPLADLCRKRDWAATPLGPVQHWSETLRFAVGHCLDSALPRCVYAGGSRVLIYNDAYVDLLGPIRHPWALGCTAREVWSDVWPRLDELVSRVERDGGAVLGEREAFVYARDRERTERRYFTFELVPIRDASGIPVGVTGTFLDVTAQVRSESALRESEQRYRHLIDASPDAVVVDVDVDDTTVYANGAAALLVGADRPHQLVGRPALAYVSGQDRESATAQLASALYRSEACASPLQQRWRRLDGREIEVEVHATPTLWRGQTARQLQVRDVTATRAAERTLRDADRRKDEFLATLAHELRNPLAPIRSAVQILGHPALAAHDLVTCRDIIRRQTQHMTTLLDDLLDVSRVTRGRVELHRERLRMQDVIDSALEIARPVLAERGHRLHLADSPEPVGVIGDRVRLAQVVSNLLTNAAKYTDVGGDVWLSLGVEDGQARIAVRDSGIGLARENLQRVFEMFSQVDAALERAQGGLGIGLALVRGLVELHGGRVEARSAGVGQGSEFIVRLPLTAAPGDACEEHPAAVRASDGGLRILLADDNPDAARALEMFLALARHEVRVAFDGVAAVAEAERFHPDVAILDIGMPGLNGYEVAQRIRRESWGRSIRLFALTGWGQEADRARAHAAGFDRHVTKPTDPDALLSMIASACGRAG